METRNPWRTDAMRSPMFNPILTAALLNFCGDKDQFSMAWDVLSALRGPDPVSWNVGSPEQKIYASLWKDKYTVPIRMWALSGVGERRARLYVDMDGTPLNAERAFSAIDELKNMMTNCSDGGEHYRNHLIRAIRAIIAFEKWTRPTAVNAANAAEGGK